MAQAQRGVGGVGVAVRRICGALERLRRPLRPQALHLGVAGQRVRRQPVEQRRAALHLVERGDHRRLLGGTQLRDGGRGGGLQRLALAGGLGRVDHGQHGLLALASHVVVRRAHHVRQLARVVGGDHPQPFRALAALEELRERAVEGVEGQPLGLDGVENAELRVDPGGERVRAQHPRAEAVDRRDPGRLGLARVPDLIQVDEAGANTLLELGGRLLGERDREDRRHIHAVVAHGAHEALDQHRRLAGARPRAHEDRAVAPLDRRQLLVGELHGASTRQIEGCEQPPR